MKLYGCPCCLPFSIDTDRKRAFSLLPFSPHANGMPFGRIPLIRPSVFVIRFRKPFSLLSNAGMSKITKKIFVKIFGWNSLEFVGVAIDWEFWGWKVVFLRWMRWDGDCGWSSSSKTTDRFLDWKFFSPSNWRHFNSLRYYLSLSTLASASATPTLAEKVIKTLP